MEPTPIPTQTPAPSSKLPWILTILLLLVVVGSGGFLLGKASAKPEPIPVETKIEAKTEVDESEWNIYADPKNTFVFSYPKTVTLNGDSKVEGGLNLYVRTKDLKNYIDEPMGYDLDTALQDQESLKNNQTGYLYGGIPDSAKLVTFSGINGKTFVTLSLLEVCDVRFDRSMVIYNDNQQILLGLSVADSRSLASKIPQYFIKDSIDCGDTLIWKSASKLVADLMANAAPQPVQSWYDTFDQILSTFKFTPPIDMSGWKPFSNSTAAFTALIPPTAKIESREPDPFKVAVQIDDLHPGRGPGGVDGWLIIVSETQDNSQKLSLRDWAKSKQLTKDELISRGIQTTPTDITIGNHPAITWTTTGGDAQIVNYLLDRQPGMTLVSINNSANPNYQTITEKIVSTFKFTN